MEKIAVIGMDAHFGAQTTIDKVERALYVGDAVESQEKTSDLTTSCQQSIKRMCTANLIDEQNVQVIIVGNKATQKQITLHEDVYAKTELVEHLSQALTLAQQALSQGQFVALIGANNVENTEQADVTVTISFDQSFSQYTNANGMASLLLADGSLATAQSSYVYAYLKGVATSEVNSEVNSQAAIAKTVSDALNQADVLATDVGLLEVSSLSESLLLNHEQQGLMLGYGYGDEKPLTTAISCARSITGEGEGFSQVLGLQRAVIATQQRFIPAINGWQQPKQDKLMQWQASNFYFPTQARPWYPNANAKPHVAAYSCLSISDSTDKQNNQYVHIIIEEHKIKVDKQRFPAEDIRSNGFIACSDLQLVLLAAEDENSLLEQLSSLEERVNALDNETAALAFIAKEQYQLFSSKRFQLGLIAQSKEELIKEITLAKAGIKKAFVSNSDWKTPKGSYFTAQPVIDTLSNDSLSATSAPKEAAQGISFLYPGIGATYVGLGRDLFHLFPEIYQGVADLADDIGSSLKDTLLNPRSIVSHSFKELKQLDLALRGSLADIAEAGVGFACVFTKVFEDVFKVKADFATGYSMGEVSMYAALGCWQQPGLMSKRLAQSDTFNHRLCGELLTLQEHWGMTQNDVNAITNEQQTPLWETYTIKATLEQLEQACEGEERVYCTIINTPDSLLLAGFPPACLRVIKKLGIRAMALNMANAIHSPPAKYEYDKMVELYTMAVNARIQTKMYSSSCYLPVPQLSKAIAISVAKCLCERVDFPRLVNTMYDKGARVFIEMGAGRSLCSWVEKILDHRAVTDEQDEQVSKPRVSVPVNAKGTNDELTYIRAVAKLVSHGVKLDLDRLFYGSIIVSKQPMQNSI